MTDDTTTAGRRWPPARLAPLAPRYRPFARAAWMLLALAAAASVVLGAWRGYVYQLEVTPRWDRLGLMTFEEETRTGWSIGFADDAAGAAGVKDHSILVAVDGRRVPADVSEEAASRLVDGPPGPVALTLRDPAGRVAMHRLMRRGDAATEGVVSNTLFFAVTTAGGAAGGLVTVLLAIFLVRRRGGDAVAMTLSAAFLAFVAGQPAGYLFWVWIGADTISDVMTMLGLLLFAVALPAFPDGRYVPRWGPWLIPLVVPVTVVGVSGTISGEATVAVVLAYMAAVAVLPVLRFRRTPPGIERQQLKWVGFGFFGAVVLAIFSMLLLLLSDAGWVPFAVRAWSQIAGWVVWQLAMLLLPVGVFVAVRRYRLWDADRVIGRSAGWALLTLVAGGVWAGCTKVVEGIVETTLGAGNAGLSAGISAVIALAVLGPVQNRVVSWLDAKFRSAILELRDLPRLLRIWQHGDVPEDVGARVTEAVARILHVPRAMLLLHSAGGYRAVGRVGIDAEDAAGWIAQVAPGGRLPHLRVDRDDPLFPMRLVLDDGAVPIGALLLGSRADGSVYTSDERQALEAIEPDLAAALRQAQRRRAHEDRLGALLDGLERRVRGIETRLT